MTSIPSSRDQASAQSSFASTLIITIVHTVLLLVLLGSLLLVVPKAKRMFADNNVAIPPSTVQVIALADWFTSFWYVALPLICVFVVADAGVLYLLGKNSLTRAIRWAWSFLLFIILLLFLCWWALALFVPYTEAFQHMAR